MVTIIKKGSSAKEIERKMRKAISGRRSKGIMKYAGKLKIDIEPLDYQKKMRDE